jgi:hypothetical protein
MAIESCLNASLNSHDSNGLLSAQVAADAKFADYKPKVAFFFPGQGAQSVGMCKVGTMASFECPSILRVLYRQLEALCRASRRRPLSVVSSLISLIGNHISPLSSFRPVSLTRALCRQSCSRSWSKLSSVSSANYWAPCDAFPG